MVTPASTPGWRPRGRKECGEVVGLYADPLLRKNGSGLLTDPARLSMLTEYQVLPGSACH